MPPGYINQNPYSQQNRSVSSLTQDRTGAPVQHLPYPVNNDDPDINYNHLNSITPPTTTTTTTTTASTPERRQLRKALRATCPNSN